MANEFVNVEVFPQTPQLLACMTKIRDEKTSRGEFIFYADRITRMLVERGLDYLPTRQKRVRTPTGIEFDGCEFIGKICAVPIIRAGESMEKAFREVCKKGRICKILIQRNERTAEPEFYYIKPPHDIANRYVLLLDPMLATGGSAKKAIEELLKHGVKENRIIFVNLVAAPEGLKAMYNAYPKVQIVTGAIDVALNNSAYILPGLGDFGDRYFGTD
jgi:uracil phosphoribosyltransferase